MLLIGRKLDYQVGYGSPAVFPNARFIRLADNPGELIDNRRGEPELLASPQLALDAMVAAAGNREPELIRPGPMGCVADTANVWLHQPPSKTAPRQAPTEKSIRAQSSMPSQRWPIPTMWRSPTAGIF